MTKIVLYLLFFGTSLASYSQDYLDDIADEACSCTEGNPKLLGLCIINIVGKFPEEVKRDFGIDVASISEGSPNRIVPLKGAKMAEKCPSALEATQERLNAETENVEENETYIGTIAKSDTDGFPSYLVENEGGERRKFVILAPIECNFNIEQEFQSLVGKSVEIIYAERKIFDSNKASYVTFNVVTSMNVK